MFPYERFYGFLKSLVHNRLFLEGAMVHGYETIEVVEWAMGYMDPQNPIGVSCSRHEGRLAGWDHGEKVSHSGCRCLTKGSFHRDTTAALNYTITEPLKLIPYYCLNHSIRPLSNNI
jgi:hypothetical protein